MADLTADVIAIIAGKLRGQKPDIKLTDRLEDLGLESLDTVEAIFDLEEKFDIQIPFSPNEVRAKFETVGDVVHAVEDFVDAKA